MLFDCTWFGRASERSRQIQASDLSESKANFLFFISISGKCERSITEETLQQSKDDGQVKLTTKATKSRLKYVGHGLLQLTLFGVHQNRLLYSTQIAKLALPRWYL
jgi:hypothetical protein